MHFSAFLFIKEYENAVFNLYFHPLKFTYWVWARIGLVKNIKILKIPQKLRRSGFSKVIGVSEKGRIPKMIQTCSIHRKVQWFPDNSILWSNSCVLVRMWNFNTKWTLIETYYKEQVHRRPWSTDILSYMHLSPSTINHPCISILT